MPRWLVLALGFAGVALAAGIGGVWAYSRGNAPPARNASVVVVERDFKITAPAVVPAGDVVFQVRNQGPDDHELIVVKETGSLPRRADAVTVDEDALERDIVGVLEAGEPGSVRDLRVHLAPGHYKLFCNMAGHFL